METTGQKNRNCEKIDRKCIQGEKSPNLSETQKQSV